MQMLATRNRSLLPTLSAVINFSCPSAIIYTFSDKTAGYHQRSLGNLNAKLVGVSCKGCFDLPDNFGFVVVITKI